MIESIVLFVLCGAIVYINALRLIDARRREKAANERYDAVMRRMAKRD